MTKRILVIDDDSGVRAVAAASLTLVRKWEVILLTARAGLGWDD